MRNYLKIPKPLFTPSSLLSPPPQPQTHPQHKPNSPMLYYTIVVVATATIVLVIYHLVIIRLCTIRYHHSLQQPPHISIRNHETPNTTISTPPHPSICNTVCLISSFKYQNQGGYELECSVCLSVFEDGEEVKRLPMCNHCFHASCIDMWLYSHFQCPLCRAPVAEPSPPSPPPSPTSFSV